jgi:hypothetical protein
VKAVGPVSVLEHIQYQGVITFEPRTLNRSLFDGINYACDIDIYRTWADLLVHNQTDLNYKRDYHCCYASRKDNQHYVYSHGEILSHYGAFMVQIESVPGVFSSLRPLHRGRGYSVYSPPLPITARARDGQRLQHGGLPCGKFFF